MEIKVKAVDGNTQKSKAEIEEQLLQKHEAQQNETQANEKPEKVEPQAEVKEKPAEETPAAEEKTPSSELNDEHVLNFIKERYNKDINSVQELFETIDTPSKITTTTPSEIDVATEALKELGLDSELTQQVLQNAGITNNQQEDQIKKEKEKEEAESLAAKGKDIAQGIMTTLMGGGEGGNLDLTKEEAYANLPAGMQPLRKQYEYLKENGFSSLQGIF